MNTLAFISPNFQDFYQLVCVTVVYFSRAQIIHILTLQVYTEWIEIVVL